MTPAELLRALDELELPLTDRNLRRWRERGVLPPWEQTGLGRGRGVHREARNDVLDLAVFLQMAMRQHSNLEVAKRQAWLAGFEYDDFENIRAGLIASWEASASKLLELDELEVAYKAARSLKVPGQTDQIAWGIEVLHRTLYGRGKTADDSEFLSSAFAAQTHSKQASASLPDEALDRVLSWTRKTLHVSTRLETFRTASPKELRQAHFWWAQIANCLMGELPAQEAVGLRMAASMAALYAIPLLIRIFRSDLRFSMKKLFALCIRMQRKKMMDAIDLQRLDSQLIRARSRITLPKVAEALANGSRNTRTVRS